MSATGNSLKASERTRSMRPTGTMAREIIIWGLIASFDFLTTNYLVNIYLCHAKRLADRIVYGRENVILLCAIYCRQSRSRSAASPEPRKSHSSGLHRKHRVPNDPDDVLRCWPAHLQKPSGVKSADIDSQRAWLFASSRVRGAISADCRGTPAGTPSQQLFVPVAIRRACVPFSRPAQSQPELLRRTFFELRECRQPDDRL